MTIESRKRRFLKNVVNNPNRGQEYWKRNSYNYPTVRQMDQFKKHHIVYDIDPALRKVIIDLNSKGYRTAGSCQGHLKENKSGFITIMVSKNQLPTRFKNNTPVAREILKNLSVKDVNPEEIISILKKHNIIVTKYEKPYDPKNGITGKFQDFYAFIFPVILNKYPHETISYYYISGNNLETSFIPKKDSVKFIQIRDSNGNYTGFKLIKNGKLEWKKDLTTRKPMSTVSTIKEIQQTAYKLLGKKFDIKKFEEEVRKIKQK
jgi:hypothetical protein